MGTYPHLLTTAPLPSLPGRIICIDSHPYLEPIPHAPGRYRHTLRVCAGCVTDYTGGYPVRRRTFIARSHAETFRCISGYLLRQRVTWLLAHNLSYDLTLAGVWQWVEEGRARLVGYVIDDPPTCIHLEMEGQRVVCVDMLNYWRCDLAAITRGLGCESPLSNPLTDTDGVATDAAACHALATAHACDNMVSLLASRLGGGWKSTAAGIAWSAYRSRRWGDVLHVHNTAEAQLLEREAYFGGRVECWKPGHTLEAIYVLDVNNLYGWCMHHYPHPRRLLSYGRMCRQDARHALSRGRGCIARCLLDTKCNLYPLRNGQHTVYPTGRFWTVLCGAEILAGIEEGSVTDVSEGCTYENGAPYTAFVEHWYSARRDAQDEGDKTSAALAKLVTSALFGRLAMRGRSWVPHDGAQPPERYCVWHERDPETGLFTLCRAVAGVAQREEDQGEWAHSCVYAAAYITSLARSRMRELRALAGVDTVYYEDTDCLHVSEAGYHRLHLAGLIHPTKLGALKLVERSCGATYWGPKAYRLDSGTVASGLRCDAQEIADGVWLQVHREGICQVPSAGPRTWVDTQLVNYTLGGRRPASTK